MEDCEYIKNMIIPVKFGMDLSKIKKNHWINDWYIIDGKDVYILIDKIKGIEWFKDNRIKGINVICDVFISKDSLEKCKNKKKLKIVKGSL